MTNAISITFHAESWTHLTDQMRIVLGQPTPTEPLRSFTDFPADGETVEPDDPGPVEDEQTQAALAPVRDATAAPAPKRSHKAAKPASTPAPTAAAEPPDALPAKAIPPLDVLKNAVTRAVRAAQKKEGPTKILDLLPGFKKTTGLDFVMSAEDKHRGALFDLVEAAELELA